jgi:hypothetical protein
VRVVICGGSNEKPLFQGRTEVDENERLINKKVRSACCKWLTRKRIMKIWLSH